MVVAHSQWTALDLGVHTEDVIMTIPTIRTRGADTTRSLPMLLTMDMVVHLAITTRLALLVVAFSLSTVLEHILRGANVRRSVLKIRNAELTRSAQTLPTMGTIAHILTIKYFVQQVLVLSQSIVLEPLELLELASIMQKITKTSGAGLTVFPLLPPTGALVVLMARTTSSAPQVVAHSLLIASDNGEPMAHAQILAVMMICPWKTSSKNLMRCKIGGPCLVPVRTSVVDSIRLLEILPTTDTVALTATITSHAHLVAVHNL